MAKRGPKGPSTSIDIEEFEKLCSFQCTQIEIAEFFNISVDTLDRHLKRHYKENFADIFKKKSSKGKISLRRKMYETAMNGNVSMMIWLSKQMLGYTDTFNHTSQVTNTITCDLTWGEDALPAQTSIENSSPKKNQ